MGDFDNKNATVPLLCKFLWTTNNNRRFLGTYLTSILWIKSNNNCPTWAPITWHWSEICRTVSRCFQTIQTIIGKPGEHPRHDVQMLWGLLSPSVITWSTWVQTSDSELFTVHSAWTSCLYEIDSIYIQLATYVYTYIHNVAHIDIHVYIVYVYIYTCMCIYIYKYIHI